MKTTELAKQLGLSGMTVRRMAADGRIPGARSTKGGHYYFPETEKFIAWLGRKQAATAGQAKEERKRLKEKAEAARLAANLPPLPDAKVAFLHASVCFQECSRLILAAFKSQQRAGPVSRWSPDYRNKLLGYLEPLELIAKALRG